MQAAPRPTEAAQRFHEACTEGARMPTAAARRLHDGCTEVAQRRTEAARRLYGPVRRPMEAAQMLPPTKAAQRLHGAKLRDWRAKS